MAEDSNSQEKIANEAIKHAMKALRKRHLLEEGAHAPAFAALSRPTTSQSSKWEKRAENLRVELQESLRSEAQLPERLIHEVAGSRAIKVFLQEKETAIIDMRKELTEVRDEYSQLKMELEEKIEALEVLMSENTGLKTQLEEMTNEVKNTEAENKILVDRCMLEKKKDADHLNEVNAMYEEVVDRLKASGLGKHGKKQVGGKVRRSEKGAESLSESTIPKTCKYRLLAHQGGCASILFEYNSAKLITGAQEQDQSLKVWDTNTGSLSSKLHGCIGSVLDLTISYDNRYVIAASSSNNLYVWDFNSGQVRYTLFGHKDKVCAVDASRIPSLHVVSAAHDHTIKIWDLVRGYCTSTINFFSNCNALCFSTDGKTIISGHDDGFLQFWDIETSKGFVQAAAHSQAVTSVSPSHNGNVVLSSGMDNLHSLFDVRSMQFCGTIPAPRNTVASDWSRSCISPDDKYVTAGSADGSVHIWSIAKGDIVRTLKENTYSVLSCAWNGLGRPLASSDKSGVVSIWT